MFGVELPGVADHESLPVFYLIRVSVRRIRDLDVVNPDTRLEVDPLALRVLDIDLDKTYHSSRASLPLYDWSRSRPRAVPSTTLPAKITPALDPSPAGLLTLMRTLPWAIRLVAWQQAQPIVDCLNDPIDFNRPIAVAVHRWARREGSELEADVHARDDLVNGDLEVRIASSPRIAARLPTRRGEPLRARKASPRSCEMFS